MKSLFEIASGRRLDVANLPEIEQYSQYTKKLKWYQQLNEEIRVKAKNNLYESENRYLEYAKIIQKNEQDWKNRYEMLQKEHQKEKEELENQLEKVYQSRGWKMLEKIRKIVRRK